jgi:hypothetical protein
VGERRESSVRGCSSFRTGGGEGWRRLFGGCFLILPASSTSAEEIGGVMQGSSAKTCRVGDFGL